MFIQMSSFLFFVDVGNVVVAASSLYSFVMSDVLMIISNVNLALRSYHDVTSGGNNACAYGRLSSSSRCSRSLVGLHYANT